MAKKKFQEAHWRPVPALPFDLPQEEQLAELRIAVNVTRYNLAVAHDEFDRAWKHYEFVEQQQAPHTFQVMAQDRDGSPSTTPRKCSLCFTERSDPRHGPVEPHDFVPLRQSLVRHTECMLCGLSQTAPVHQSHRQQRKKPQPPPGFSKAEHRKRDLEVALKRRP